jgi:uncharacterized cupin superfamily protein
MEPVFLQPGEGERIAGDGELGVTLLADFEEIGVDRVRSQPGGEAPAAHVHLRHLQCFFVLEGELTFRYFVHGLASARDEEELRAVRAAFDQQPAPEYAAADPGSVLVRTGATAETVTLYGNRIAFLTEAEESGGAIGAIEYAASQAFAGPSLHFHREMFDVFAILDGTLGIEIDGERRTAGPGAFAIAPGAVHTFSNPSDESLRLLDLYVPGGFDRFFKEMAAASTDGPPDPAVAKEISARYDWESV